MLFIYKKDNKAITSTVKEKDIRLLATFKDAQGYEAKAFCDGFNTKFRAYSYTEKLIEETLNRIEHYANNKEGSMFDSFYHSHLDFMRECILYCKDNMFIVPPYDKDSDENHRV